MMNTYSDFVENASFYQQRQTIFATLGTNVELCKRDLTRRQLHIVFEPLGAVPIPNYIYMNNNEQWRYVRAQGYLELDLDWYQHGIIVTNSFHIQATSGAGFLCVYESLLIPRPERSVSSERWGLSSLSKQIKGLRKFTWGGSS